MERLSPLSVRLADLACAAVPRESRAPNGVTGERLQRLAWLSGRLLQADLAFVLLFGQDDLCSAGPSEAPGAICRILTGMELPIAVTDTRTDPRVSRVPGIMDCGIGSYLAVPLADREGTAIGAVCVASCGPRNWAGEDAGALSDLAELVVSGQPAAARGCEPADETASAREKPPSDAPGITKQMVWLTDMIGRTTCVNQHYTAFTGLSSEQSRAEGWLAVLHPSDRPRVLATWRQAVADRTDYETEMRVRRASDGSFRWVLARASPLRGADGRVERWIGIGTDIDDRKRAEETTHALIEALGVAVYTTDAEGRLTFYNEAAVRLWGWRPALGDSRWCGSWRLSASDGRPLPHEACPMGLALREKRAVRGGEAVAERPDGSRVPFIAYPTPLFGPDGALAGGINVLVDITERKATEAALTESEARLRSILGAVPDAIVAIDAQGAIESFSATAEQLFGYNAREVAGQPVAVLIPGLECGAADLRSGQRRWRQVDERRHGQPPQRPAQGWVHLPRRDYVRRGASRGAAGLYRLRPRSY